MTERMDTIIIGAGQAGLAASYYLIQQERKHVILEKRRIGEAWRSGRWDSFTLVSPNWTLQLPGFPYNGDDPKGYLTRDEIVQYLEDYARMFNAPVRTGIEVKCIQSDAQGFRIETDHENFTAKNVIIATGAFQKPKIPPYATEIPSHIRQLHSSEYSNPGELPRGAVLVVGSGQSGCQIAEELYQQGRKVYLCTGKVGRVPRRYGDKDIFEWGKEIGMFDKTVDKLDSPVERFMPNPQLTGKDGGRSLNLHRFARDGVTLLGRLQNARGSKLTIAADLKENLAHTDQFEDEFIDGVSGYLQQNDLPVPEDPREGLRYGYDCEIITELDLDKAGITSIIWSTGYLFDFRWIQFEIFDEYGYPVHQRGVTDQPGLYFIGLQWLHKSKSSLFFGIADDAAYITDHLANRNT